MKKIFAKLVAGIAAATLMVGAFATSAFAADFSPADASSTIAYNDGTEKTSAVKWTVDLSTLTEDQIASIAKVEATITLTDTNYANGVIGGNVDGSWSASDELEVNGTGTFTWEPSGTLSYIEVQIWWVNPTQDADGNAIGKGTAEVTAVKLLDASGNEVGAATEDTAATDSTSGDALPFVVVALALSALAAGAVVVTRKVSFER